MRISDWSSDVCSSDLARLVEQREIGFDLLLRQCAIFRRQPAAEQEGVIGLERRQIVGIGGQARELRRIAAGGDEGGILDEKGVEDRKSDGQGKSVTVSVVIGGGRLNNNKKY